MGEKTPYASFGPKFANDLEGYLSNLIAGHTGTGRGHALGTAEYPNEPDTSHVPYKLTRHEADFLNTVINNTGAFAKHEDAKALRELARINGTLITPEGETNRWLHRSITLSRTTKPSIRSSAILVRNGSTKRTLGLACTRWVKTRTNIDSSAVAAA
jgi:hypothetical protein